ncbi:heme exporter protein CcmB [Planctomycetota bacterium]|nr:heme exporter protein CcmB [Planctomycetota bacterium]
MPSAFTTLIKREILVEARTKSLLSAMGLFAVLCVVVVGLGVKGLPFDETYDRFVLAMLWVCSLFAAVVGMNRAAVADRRNGFFSALLLTPHDAALFYTVRLLTVGFFLVGTQVLMALVSIWMLRFPLFEQSPVIIGVILLADIGILAPGVLLSSATSRARGGEALLTIALLPVIVPVFLGATGATDALQAGLGFEGAEPYLLILLICAALFSALGLLLFGKLNEE